MQKIICIVGMPGSGKSTALEIAQKFGTVVIMGDVVREETLRRELSINSTSLGQIAQALREEEGPDVIAQRCMKKIKNISADICFLDGIRSLHEVSLFQQHFSLVIIALSVPDAIRHEWLIQRRRKDDSTSLEEIQKRDSREIRFGIKEVIRNSDFVILNNNSKEHLRNECEAIFRKVFSHD
jgi:dephospho-CoA kinase